MIELQVIQIDAQGVLPVLAHLSEALPRQVEEEVGRNGEAAGGSRPGGEVVGRSDRFAAYPADDPITPQDLAASLLDALGVAPGLAVRDAFGRPAPLSGGRMTPALFGS